MAYPQKDAATVGGKLHHAMNGDDGGQRRGEEGDAYEDIGFHLLGEYFVGVGKERRSAAGMEENRLAVEAPVAGVGAEGG